MTIPARLATGSFQHYDYFMAVKKSLVCGIPGFPEPFFMELGDSPSIIAPRKCTPVRWLKMADGADALLVQIDPKWELEAAICGYDKDTTVTAVVLVPRASSDKIDISPHWPLFVNVLTPKNKLSIASDRLNAEDYRRTAWGTLYPDSFRASWLEGWDFAREKWESWLRNSA